MFLNYGLRRWSEKKSTFISEKKFMQGRDMCHCKKQTLDKALHHQPMVSLPKQHVCAFVWIKVPKKTLVGDGKLNNDRLRNMVDHF